ncbi:MAG TPA: trehalose-phosphatase [Ktedonobacteraceae bacterium]|nr:trehalose-phosphatase [Ktedonobacteraceae bacterium]
MTEKALRAVLAERPLGLVFDIDGTLSQLVPLPDDARLYAGVAELLEELRDRPNVHVGIMTGRGIDDGAKLVGVDGLTYIGTHGLEWSDGLPSLHPVQLVPGAEEYIIAGNYVLDIAERELSEVPGIIVQRKHVGGSIHYRRSPDPDEARQRILAAVEEPARKMHMRIGEGKKVVEVLAPLHVDKGQALRRFVQRFSVHGVVFAGDDRTDLYAMQEVERLRKDNILALAIAVQHADTLPGILEHADIVVQGVEGMAALLRELADNV